MSIGTPDLIIDFAQLETAKGTTERVRSKLEQTAQGYDKLAESVGQKDLGNVIGDFSSSWAIHRRKLLEEAAGLGTQIQKAIGNFRAVDIGTAQPGGGSGGGGTPHESRPATPADGPGAAPGSGSGAPNSGQPLPNAPTSPAASPSDPLPRPVEDPTAAPPPQGPRSPIPPSGDDVDDLFSDIQQDSQEFQSLLGRWADEAVRLDALGLPLTALGAGTLAVLSMYGKLPTGYTYNPDGTVTKSSRVPGRTDAQSVGEVLDRLRGPDSGQDTPSGITAEQANDVLAPPEPQSEPGEPTTPPSESAEGDQQVGDAAATSEAETAPAIDAEGSAIGERAADQSPAGAEQSTELPAAPAGSTDAAIASEGRASGGGAAGSGGGGGGGLPLPAPPPSGSAVDASEALAGAGQDGKAAIAAGSAAASAAALSGLSAPPSAAGTTGMHAGPAGAAPLGAKAPDMAPHVAAMGSLSALGRTSPGGAALGPAAGLGGVGAPGSTPGGTSVFRGEGSERVRAAKEALARLAHDQDADNTQESE